MEYAKNYCSRLSGWLIASVVLFALIGWTSSAQIPVVIYKLSWFRYQRCWVTGSTAVFSQARPDSFCPGKNRCAAPLR
ncbi:hypothetical protein JT306_16320 [Salmonella enterica subsp. enterica serovar Kentucky]|nr:hypothetical protein [Salmonella enterica subsp. enterica serovar Kentucky]